MESDSYDGHDVKGAFSTEEKAQEFIDAYGFYKKDCHIEEWDVK
jgi:hypothetical protein